MKNHSERGDAFIKMLANQPPYLYKCEEITSHNLEEMIAKWMAFPYYNKIVIDKSIDSVDIRGIGK